MTSLIFRNNGKIIIKYGCYLSKVCEQTEELCLEAVTIHGMNLFYVKILKSREMCLAAVRQNGLALEHVPIRRRKDKNLIKELYYTAIRQNGLALEFVVSEHKSEELCLIAVQQNGFAYKFLPKIFKKIDYVKRNYNKIKK
jgi:hypothetical protein